VVDTTSGFSYSGIMAVTLTTIANEALMLIGEASVTAITSTTEINATRCSSLMEGCVKEVASEAAWRCLTKRDELTASKTGPEFDWDYSYPFPSDLIRLTKYNESDDVLYSPNFEVEGKNILTDDDEVRISYVAYTSDPTAYDPLFVQCLTIYLAMKLATVCRQDDTMANNLLMKYREKLSRARQINGWIGKRIKRSPIESSYLRRARYNPTPQS